MTALIVLPLLHTAESLGVTLASIVRDHYGADVRVPMHVEQSLWAGYRYLYGPGGRQRVGLELAGLRQMVGNVMGGKLKLEQCQLFAFPRSALQDGPAGGPLSRAQRATKKLQDRKAAFRQKMEMWAVVHGPRAGTEARRHEGTEGKGPEAKASV